MEKFIDQLVSSESGFDEALRKLVADRSPGKNIEVTKIVDEIIESVRVEGDIALLRYTNKFDHRQLTSPQQLAVSVAGEKKNWKGSCLNLWKEVLNVLLHSIRSRRTIPGSLLMT